MRLASAIKFDEVLKQYNSITSFRDPIFRKVLKNMNKDAKVLQEYVNKHLETVSDAGKNMIIDAADINDLYDKELWGEYTRLRKEVERFDFLALITPPQAYNHELKARYNKLMNQYLLFRKKYYDDFKNATIVFEQPETKTETNEVV